MGRLGTTTQSPVLSGAVGGRLPKKTPDPVISSPVTPPAPTPKYFYGKTDPNGGAIGYSQNEFDSSGKPYFAYRNPGDGATTTDKTRVSTTFDPRVATTTPTSSFYNTREPNLRAKVGGRLNVTPNQEVDHVTPLAISGSNNDLNLRAWSTDKNQADAPTVQKLQQDVSKGRLPLLNAQVQEARNKNLPDPWTPAGQIPQENFDNTKTGILVNTIKGLPKAGLDTLQSIGQASMRGYGAIGAKIAAGDINAQFTPQGQFQEDLYGTNKPTDFTSVGQELTQKNIPILTPAVGAFLSAGDLLPGEKAVSKIGTEVKDTYKAMTPAEKQAGKIAYDFTKSTPKSVGVSTELKDATARELSMVDPTPVKVNGQIDLSNSEIDFRLSQLKDIQEKRALNNNEVREAIDLLNKSGIDVTKSKPVGRLAPEGGTRTTLRTADGKFNGSTKTAMQSSFGGMAGFQTDENGNVTFDPKKAAMGAIGMGLFNKARGGRLVPQIAEDIKNLQGETKPIRQELINSKIAEIEKLKNDRIAQPPAEPTQPLKYSAEGRPMALTEREKAIAGGVDPASFSSQKNVARGRLQQSIPQTEEAIATKSADVVSNPQIGSKPDLSLNPKEFQTYPEESARLSGQPYQEPTSLQQISHDQNTYLKGAGINQTQGGSRAIEEGIANLVESSGSKIGKGGDFLTSDKIVGSKQTPVNEKVNVLDYLRTPDRVLNKIGLANEGKVVRQQYEKYVQELPKNIDKITQWSKEVPAESNQRIFQALDGKPVQLNPTEQKVTGEIKTWLSQWADRLGLPQDKRVSNYITRLFDDQIVKKEFDEDLAKIIGNKVPGSVYDPFLQKRLGALGYKENTWAALDAYVKRATRKVYMDPALEGLKNASKSLEDSQFKYVKRYADRVNLRPTEIDNYFDNLIKSSPVGYRLGQRPIANLSRTLRQWTFRGMIGGNIGSALRNISQGVNTYAKLGERYTLTGYAKLAINGTDELKRVGVLSDSFIQDRALSSTKKVLEKLDKGLFFMFDTAEKINRGSAYYGAKAKAIAEGMTEEKAIEYAKKIVRDTQFSFGSVDTPVLMQSDITKVLGQFQSYTLKQSEFLSEMAKNKDVAGLLRYALGSTLFFYTIGKAFGMNPKDFIPSYNLGTPPSLKVIAEAKNAVLDTPDKNGQPRSLQQKLSDVGNAAIGYIPGGAQAKKTYQGIKSIQQGGSYTASGNLQFKQNTSVGGRLQSVLFGKYASQNAQDHFSNKPTEIENTYSKVQDLVKAGKQSEARRIVDSLSDAQYKEYKKVKTAAKAHNTSDLKKNMVPIVSQVKSLVQQGKTAEAQSIVNKLSDDEYRAYKLVKAGQK